ncbi:MAG: AAA family ATPase [Saprospiraceae bacterium]
MIKSIYIDNFKALNDFKMEFQPLTLLIGANSVGKSTVLQALELLAYFTKGKEFGELNNYLKERGWSAKDLRSNLSRKRHITFRVEFELEESIFEWEIILTITENGFELIKESVIEGKKKHLWSHNESTFVLDDDDDDTLYLIRKPFTSSTLSFFDGYINPKLSRIKNYLNNLALFDFSSTEQLKSRNLIVKNAQIGRNGENLAAYLHQLSKEELVNLTTQLQTYAPFFETINIRKRSRNEVEIDIKEKFSNNRIDAQHLSDGMMRLLAILTLALTESGYSTMMIEEIEDGINPNLAGEVIKTLTKVTQETNRQFILTTHNPLILDWVDVASIHFLYRDKKGFVKQKTFNELPTVLQNLDYMNPGEIWINFDKDELIQDNE